MAMRKHSDLLASVGEFRDAQGRKAKRWIKCGVVMRDADSGALSIKIDCVPISPAWSGWMAVRNLEEPDAHRPEPIKNHHTTEESK